MNNQRPKLLVQEQPIQLKLLRDVYSGENGRGKYFLYTVSDETGQEYAWFPQASTHEAIQKLSLKKGSVFTAKKNGNGVEVSVIGQPEMHEAVGEDEFRAIMRKSLIDAIELTQSIKELQFHNDDVRAISNSLFIARTR